MVEGLSEVTIAAELVKHRSATYATSEQATLPEGMGWAWLCSCGHILFGHNTPAEVTTTEGSYVECILASHQASAIMTLINGEKDGYSPEEHAQLADTIWHVKTKDFGGHSTQDARFLATRLLGLGYRHVDNPLGYTATEHIQLSNAIWHTEADGFTGYSTRDAHFLATCLLGVGYRCVAGPTD